MNNIRFVQSATQPIHYPVHANPETALVGRSNVGKSSLINALAGRRTVARVSRQPGRTQTLNFYSTDDGIWFVDLPGYGYAAVPQRVQRGFAPMIETYLQERENLVGVIHVLDARHAPTALDLTMKEWLLAHGLPMIYVATKWDKLKMNEQTPRRKELERRMGGHVIPFSATKGTGHSEVKGIFHSWSKETGWRE